jgi:N4-gp56 family major capsid protein
MAYTQIATGSAQATGPIWSDSLLIEAQNAQFMLNFVGKGPDACIVEKDFPQGRGDTVNQRLSPDSYTRRGHGANDTIVGNEGADTFLNDSFIIDYLAESKGLADPMSQQRINHDLHQLALTKLGRWWGYRYDEAILNQMAGYGPCHTNSDSGVDYKLCGSNACILIDDNHHVWADGDSTGHTTDALVAADTGATMNCDVIDKAVLYASSSDVGGAYRMAPGPDGYYNLIMHPQQWHDLKHELGQHQLMDIHRAKLEGDGKKRNSAWEEGYLGIWNKVKLHVHDQIPLGVDASTITTSVANCRRAVFFGACSTWIGWGAGYGSGDHIHWSEINNDHHRVSIAAQTVWGCKRAQFNNSSGTTESYGTIVVSTYSAV